jgi:hypothetical protein
MHNSEKIIVRTVAFLVSTVISVSLFALFSTWAWIHLDPVQQDAIAAVNTPWFGARSDRVARVNDAGAARGETTPDYRTVGTRVAHNDGANGLCTRTTASPRGSVCCAKGMEHAGHVDE